MKKLLLVVLSLVLVACGNDVTIVDLEPEIIYVDQEVEVEVQGDVWIEHFYQPSDTNGTDILWVIDFSCSMQSQIQQDKLAAGIEAMVNALPASGWRLNIISADPNDGEVEEQFPLVPGDGLVETYALLDAISHREQEAGLASSWKYFYNNEYASTWLRSDATLLTIFVSDEQDQSLITWQDWLVDYKALRLFGSVFASAIINPSLPDGYREVVEALNGVEVNVLSDDWGPGMAQATEELEPYEDWTLEFTPHPETIIVFKDGVEFEYWYYHVESNTIFFDILPGTGALVEIGYIIKDSE